MNEEERKIHDDQIVYENLMKQAESIWLTD